MNAKASHVIAVLLLSAGQVLQFLNSNPAIAAQLHVTATVMTVAGFVVALLSQQLFGSPTPPAQPPLADKRGFVKLGVLFAATCVAFVLVAIAAYASGCANPAGTVVKVAPPAVASADCIIADASKGDGIAQIVEDCGGDVGQVIAVLVDPAIYSKVSSTAAYAEAGRAKLAFRSSP